MFTFAIFVVFAIMLAIVGLLVIEEATFQERVEKQQADRMFHEFIDTF